MRALKLTALAAAALMGIALLVSLGVWQLHRLVWKHQLIQRVDERINATPVAAPGPAEWASVSAREREYLRVLVHGHYLNDRETLVQAVTKFGAGFWVMTPFNVDDGYTVLINRGFVSPSHRSAATRLQGQIEGETAVTGLLRMSEPKGGFLRVNERSSERWYSRDVGAISAARGLAFAAPYFIDADAVEPTIAGAPLGGLTVVAFPNNHLAYALTWFTLALMLAGGTLLVFRHERGNRARNAQRDAVVAALGSSSCKRTVQRAKSCWTPIADATLLGVRRAQRKLPRRCRRWSCSSLFCSRARR